MTDEYEWTAADEWTGNTKTHLVELLAGMTPAQRRAVVAHWQQFLASWLAEHEYDTERPLPEVPLWTPSRWIVRPRQRRRTAVKRRRIQVLELR